MTHHMQWRRIIPARAGFTLAHFETFPAWPDHPRSRGVYTGTAGDDACLGGSSPLARGLRPLGSPQRGPARIIPARAGFTEVRFLSSLMVTDHPRSRGVYLGS